MGYFSELVAFLGFPLWRPLTRDVLQSGHSALISLTIPSRWCTCVESQG